MVVPRSKRRINNVASIPSPVVRVSNTVKEIKQPAKPSLPIPVSTAQVQTILRSYHLVDSRLAIIAEHSRMNGNCELEEVTTVQGHKTVQNLAIIVVSYGYDQLRYNAGKHALERIDRANPKPGKKIFIELDTEKRYEYLTKTGWDYHFYTLTPSMQGLFQKEALWNIGTKLAFQDDTILNVVLLDVDCAFHDNSWAYHIERSLAQREFCQPFAAIVYTNQKDCGMSTGSIPSIAYCMNTKQSHPSAVPGGSFACTRNFFYNVLNGSWPIHAVGSGDVTLWRYLFGHVPVISKSDVKAIAPYGRYSTLPVGYAPLLLNHFYHGPMANRMYRTRDYIANRCADHNEIYPNKDGILVWSNAPIGKIMSASFNELKKQTNAYLQIGRAFTILDTKNTFKKYCKQELGNIDSNHHLKIVTVFKKNGVYMTQQIDTLRDAVRRTFKCPYTFHIVTDDPHLFLASEAVQSTIPANLIPAGYEWIMISSIQEKTNTSILYLAPDVKLVGSCEMSPCEDNAIYLSRINRVWNTKIMYFKQMEYLRRAFTQDILSDQYNLESIYPSAANYLVAKAQQNDIKIHDVLFHIDYDIVRKEQDKTTNVII